MKRRYVILSTLPAAALLCAMALAQAVQAPYVNINRYRHGNLAAAQDNIVQPSDVSARLSAPTTVSSAAMPSEPKSF
jgi:hypothetical protein